jgi:hypothetical protein
MTVRSSGTVVQQTNGNELKYLILYKIFILDIQHSTDINKNCALCLHAFMITLSAINPYLANVENMVSS